MNIFWFRRDLRLIDNHALSKSLHNGCTQTIFIFDEFILNTLKNKKDARIQYIYNSLKKIHLSLKNYNSSLKIYKGNILECWKQIIFDFQVNLVFCNEDYEPYAQKRDLKVFYFLNSMGINMHFFKDQVIFSPNEVLKSDGTPYVIYTPYSKKWKKYFNNIVIPSYSLITQNFNISNFEFPSLKFLEFSNSFIQIPKLKLSKNLIRNYSKYKNLPYLNATSNLGIYLRFGTISIREVILKNYSVNEIFINELIWREFFMQILYHFPKNQYSPFKKKYNKINWMNNKHDIDCWKFGITGFPLIDAGMRELNQTGRIHNRIRMLTSNFLTKHLLVDWRIGEEFFAEKLLDFELSSNNGNWQWSAGCGCDAVPYFRIFNPNIQQKKVDPKLEYINRWIPEINTFTYPKPIIDLNISRKRALVFFKNYFSHY